MLTPVLGFAATKELNVPFSSQAPYGIWIEPWKTACEETSTTLIDLFYSGYKKEKVDSTIAKKKILHLVHLENKYLKLNKDNKGDQIV